MAKEGANEVGPNTRTTLAVLCSILAVCVAATAGGAAWAVKVDSRLDTLAKDHWGVAAECEYALRLAIANPGMQVPDPRDPRQMIVIRAK